MGELVCIVIVIIFLVLAYCYLWWAVAVVLTLIGAIFLLYARHKKLFQTPEERKRRDEKNRMAQHFVLTMYANARQKAKDKMRPMIVDASLSCRSCNSLALPIAFGSQSFDDNCYRCIRCRRQFTGPEFRFGFSVQCIMREEYQDLNQKITDKLIKEFGEKAALEITTYEPDDPVILFAEVKEELAHERA